MAATLRVAAPPAVLTNPADGTPVWYHGTTADFDTFGADTADGCDGCDDSGSSVTHWNTLLGVHWTSLRPVAVGFAAGRWSHQVRSSGPGFVFAATLGVTRPRHFASEFDLDAAAFALAWDWADAHDPMSVHDDCCDALGDGCTGVDEHEPGSPVDRHVRAFYAAAPGPCRHWLGSHPDVEAIASRVVDACVADGFDGVTYGNEIEGPAGHRCAVAFDPAAITVLDRAPR